MAEFIMGKLDLKLIYTFFEYKCEKLYKKLGII